MYRARDPRLARDVALKVLPASFAEDAERLARFQREAQVLARSSIRTSALSTVSEGTDQGSSAAVQQVIVVQHWVDELRRRVPAN